MEKSTKFLFLGAFDWVVHIRQPDVHVFLISFAIIALKFYRFLFLKNFRSQPQTTRFSVHFVFLWSQFCFIAFHWVLFFLRLSFCIIIAKEISLFSSINIFRIVTHVKLFGYIATVIWWGSATLPAFFFTSNVTEFIAATSRSLGCVDWSLRDGKTTRGRCASVLWYLYYYQCDHVYSFLEFVLNFAEDVGKSDSKNRLCRCRVLKLTGLLICKKIERKRELLLIFFFWCF